MLCFLYELALAFFLVLGGEGLQEGLAMGHGDDVVGCSVDAEPWTLALGGVGEVVGVVAHEGGYDGDDVVYGGEGCHGDGFFACVLGA